MDGSAGCDRSKDWPYVNAEPLDVPLREPSWRCPEGICECHRPEDEEPHELTVLLCDELARPMPGARCRVLYRDRVINEDRPNADGEGWISVVVPRPVRVVTLEWAPADTPLATKYPYRKRYLVDLEEEDDKRSLRRRLHNLGFSRRARMEDNVKEFQRAFDYEEITGEVEDIRSDLLKFHDEGGIPPLDEQEDELDEDLEEKERLPPTEIPFSAFALEKAGEGVKKKRKPKRKKEAVQRKAPPKTHKPTGGARGKGVGTARPMPTGTLTLNVCSLFALEVQDARSGALRPRAVRCRWDAIDSHPVPGALVELFDAAMAPVGAFTAANPRPRTNRFGGVRLNIAGLPDGKYILKLNPPEGHELRGALPGPVTDKAVRNAQLRPVGPADDFPKDPRGHTRFRFLEIEIEIVRGGVKDGGCRLARGMLHQDDVPEHTAVAAHGAVARESPSRLLIDWRPDWVRCAFADERKKLQADPREASDPTKPTKHLSPVHFIVLHHTDADTPGSTINHFCDVVNNSAKTGAHYLVDVDGHAIKTANEAVRVLHSGECCWYDLDSYEGSAMEIAGFSWNDISVAIEQVHKGSDPYMSTLVAGTKNLIERIRSVHGTSPHNVLGHGEIALHPSAVIRGKRVKVKHLGRKAPCPGEVYDWHILENSGNATRPALRAGLVPHDCYGQLFIKFPSESINTVNGNKTIVTVAIAGLQLTLHELGYFVNFTATYDEPTARAVEAFQNRYFSGKLRETERAHIKKGRMRLANLLTIERMHQVLKARGGFKY